MNIKIRQVFNEDRCVKHVFIAKMAPHYMWLIADFASEILRLKRVSEESLRECSGNVDSVFSCYGRAVSIV